MKYFYLLLFFPFLFFSQNKDSVTSNIQYSIKAQYGQVLKTNFYMTNIEDLGYGGASFMISKKTNGEKLWQRKYNNPTIGLGVTAFDFMKHEEFGNAVAVYGNYTANAKKKPKYDWNYWINFGISYGSKPYNYPAYANPTISTKANMYVGVGTELNYYISKHFDLGLGLAINHLSNGSVKSPNKGMNFAAPQLSLVYHPEEYKEENISSDENTRFDLINTIELSSFYGRKMAHYKREDRSTLPDPYSGFFYNIYGLEALYTKQFSFKSSWGIGVGLNYDEEYNHIMYAENGTLKHKQRFDHQRLLFSIFPTYRLNIERFKLDMSLGYYPFKESVKYNRYKIFQKLGIRYLVNDRFFVSFGINATDFHEANYLEWKLGYTLFKKKRQL